MVVGLLATVAACLALIRFSSDPPPDLRASAQTTSPTTRNPVSTSCRFLLKPDFDLPLTTSPGRSAQLNMRLW